jgi:hypothetical protein
MRAKSASSQRKTGGPPNGSATASGPKEEVVLGRDELDIDELDGELAQGEHGLEAGNASSTDENVEIATAIEVVRVIDPSSGSWACRTGGYCATSSSPPGQA